MNTQAIKMVGLAFALAGLALQSTGQMVGERGVGAVGGSYAQERYSIPGTMETENVLSPGRRGIHLGDAEIHPSIGFYAVSEDNLFLSSETPTEESYMVLSPGVSVRYGKNPKRSLTMGVSSDISIDNDEDPEDMDNIQVGVGGRLREGRSSLYGDYTYRHLRTGDILIGDRISKTSHSLGAGYDRNISRKTAWGIHGNYTRPDYEEENYTDYEDITVSGRFSWKALDKSTFFLQGTYGWTEVDSRIDEYADADYVEGSVGVRSDLSARWNLTGRAGYQVRSFENPEIEDVEGYTGGLVLDGYMFDYWNVGLGLWSVIQPTVNEAGATTTEFRVQPSVSRRLWVDELVGSASLVWGRVEYSSPDTQEAVGEISVPFVYDEREDDYQGFSLALDWFVAEGLRTGLEYSYVENDWNGPTDVETTNYEAGRWLFRVEYVY